jgi:hypothetical protein
MSATAVVKFTDAEPAYKIQLEPPMPADFSVSVPAILQSGLLAEGCIERFRRRGLQRITVVDAVDDQGLGADVVAALRLVRECTAQQISIRWTLSNADLRDLSPLFSLYPPDFVLGQTSAAEWTRSFRFSSLYWRHGPGFVQISDARGSMRHVYKLKAQRLIEVFLALLDGVEATVAARRDAQPLLQEGLAVEIAGWIVALPYRMRAWPIPCSSA